MNSRKAKLALAGFAAAALLFVPRTSFAQGTTVPSSRPSTSDRWLHVRVESQDNRGESVKVNVPLELAEKILPTINKDRLHNGKVKIESAEVEGVDLPKLLEAVRGSKDGEFVSVQGHDSDVRVAKEGAYFLVYITEKEWTSAKSGKSGAGEDSDKSTKSDKAAKSEKSERRSKSRVEVKVPMKVVDALFSAGKDEIDVLAGLRALSATGDTELVSVKDGENTVRVWLDSKNVSD